MCDVASGSLAWTTVGADDDFGYVGFAAGPTDDVVISQLSPEAKSGGYAQRWDATGALLSSVAYSVYYIPSGTQGSLGVTNLVVDAQNNVNFGLGAYYTFGDPPEDPTQGELWGSYQKVDRCGNVIWNDGSLLCFGSGAGLEGIVTCYGTPPYGSTVSNGYLSADAAGDVSVFLPSTPGPGLFVDGNSQLISASGAWQGPPPGSAYPYSLLAPDGSSIVFLQSTTAVNLGCQPLTPPTGGSMIVVAKLDASGCVWSNPISLTGTGGLTTPAVGADGSVALTVTYSGTIDFGAGPVSSTGTNALAVARFDGSGNLLWADSFGGPGSSFSAPLTAGGVAFPLAVTAAGTLALATTYTGTVELSTAQLPSTDDTLVATFDSFGNLKRYRTAQVGNYLFLMATGSCGLFVATTSPTADFGTGPLVTAASTIGIAAFGL